MSDSKQNIADKLSSSGISSLKESYTHIIDVLHDMAVPDDVMSGSGNALDPQAIINATLTRIRRLTSFSTSAILLINDEFEFDIHTCLPENQQDKIKALVNQWVEEDIFSWAINQNRAVVLHGDDNYENVLHVITTRSNVMGMFVGLLPSFAKPQNHPPAHYN